MFEEEKEEKSCALNERARAWRGGAGPTVRECEEGTEANYHDLLGLNNRQINSRIINRPSVISSRPDVWSHAEKLPCASVRSPPRVLDPRL